VRPAVVLHGASCPPRAWLAGRRLLSKSFHLFALGKGGPTPAGNLALRPLSLLVAAARGCPPGPFFLLSETQPFPLTTGSRSQVQGPWGLFPGREPSPHTLRVLSSLSMCDGLTPARLEVRARGSISNLWRALRLCSWVCAGGGTDTAAWAHGKSSGGLDPPSPPHAGPPLEANRPAARGVGSGGEREACCGSLGASGGGGSGVDPCIPAGREE
jgi:hypothetical protein